MTTLWRTLLGVLLCVAAASAQEGRGSSPEVERLYQEAQRYQLGVDRPVDVRKAIALYQRVIQQDSQHTDAYYNLAGLCFQQMRYDLAGRFYREVIKLRPGDGDAYNNLGAVYDNMADSFL